MPNPGLGPGPRPPREPPGPMRVGGPVVDADEARRIQQAFLVLEIRSRLQPSSPRRR